MGPYLTVPKKEKETENGENVRVGIEDLLIIVNRLNLEHVECKDGETQWRIHTSVLCSWMAMFTFLVSLMVMEVSKIILIFCLGREVALWVKDKYIAELVKL